MSDLDKQDIKWLAAAGAAAAQLRVSSLEGVALWWAYELSRHADLRDIRIDDTGALTIYLNDDVNRPGWYYYRAPAISEQEARTVIESALGPCVSVPIEAATSTWAVRRD
jgi:hypothetical protein